MIYTRQNLFEYVIMHFRIYNNLQIFQTYINEILQKFLDNFCTTHLDNILIYNKSLFVYIEYV